MSKFIRATDIFGTELWINMKYVRTIQKMNDGSVHIETDDEVEYIYAGDRDLMKYVEKIE